MRSAVKPAFMIITPQLEGSVNYMYLDTEGLVTTGYGNLIDPESEAIVLDWTVSGLPASTIEIYDEWEHIKGLQAFRQNGGGFFKQFTTLRATTASIARLVENRLDAFEVTFASRFDDWPNWPAAAQLATLSLAWACGNLAPTVWPKLNAALDAGDFIVAAANCAIGAPVNESLAKRNALNSNLYLEASHTTTPDVITTPLKLA